MKIEKVEIKLGFTSNIGNYESLRTDVLLGGTLEPGEPVDEAVKELYGRVEQQLVEAAKEVNESLTKEARRKTQIDPE